MILVILLVLKAANLTVPKIVVAPGHALSRGVKSPILLYRACFFIAVAMSVFWPNAELAACRS